MTAFLGKDFTAMSEILTTIPSDNPSDKSPDNLSGNLSVNNDAKDNTTPPHVTVIKTADVAGGLHVLLDNNGQLQQLFVDNTCGDILTDIGGDEIVDTLRTTGRLGLATADTTALEGLEPRFDSGTAAETIFSFVDCDGAPQVRVKLYHTIEIGQHPETETISRAAFSRAPALYSEITVRVHGHDVVVGMIYEAFDGRTGTAVFDEYARADLYSAAEAEDLGATLRVMHDALLFAFPSETVDGQVYAASLQKRFDDAAAACEKVEFHANWVTELLGTLTGPIHTQRTHGFLTLDQLRLSDDHTRWSITGFGGNPSHSFETRRQPQCPLWDIATLQASLEMLQGAGLWSTSIMRSLLVGYDTDEVETVQMAHLAVAYAELAVVHCTPYDDESCAPIDALRHLGDRFRAGR